MCSTAEVGADRQRLASFVDDVIARCASQPDLDDFFLWWGGTLEYWIHIAASSVGQKARWAARSEIPYVTGLPARGSKSNVKWADGAVLWDDGLLVLLEVKSIPMRAALGSSAQHIPRDVAALLSADLAGTVVHERASDTYTDERWWDHRQEVERTWGLAIAVVHGRAPLDGAADAFEAALARGRAGLKNAHRPNPPRWLTQVDEVLAAPLLTHHVVSGDQAAGAFYAWGGPIR